MRPAVALSAFAATLVAVFGGTYAVGAAVDPVASDVTGAGATAGGDDHARGEERHDAPAAGSAGLPGLAVSQDGYTLHLATTALPAGTTVPFTFTVTGPDDQPVRDYTETHEKELHLVVVHRDLVDFQHVHPTRSADGTWQVPLTVRRAGAYRVFADFAPAATGRTVTLGADLAVGGAYSPAALPPASGTAGAGDLDVALSGSPVAGRESTLTFRVTRGGAPVRDIERYLGAYGHLVSLRVGDLAYLHTHPVGDAPVGRPGGPEISFGTTFPTPGTYRLFLDLKVGGTVRTAAFTVTVGEVHS